MDIVFGGTVTLERVGVQLLCERGPGLNEKSKRLGSMRGHRADGPATGKLVSRIANRGPPRGGFQIGEVTVLTTDPAAARAPA